LIIYHQVGLIGLQNFPTLIARQRTLEKYNERTLTNWKCLIQGSLTPL